jgi:signal transduction histidine kinase
LRGADGELIGFAKVTRDLTERRNAEDQARRLAAEEAARAAADARSDELAALNTRLRQQSAQLEAALASAEEARNAAEHAAEAAREAYRELDQFAYAASHDLRAPLRGVSNLAQWIEADCAEVLNAESVEHMRLLQGRVRRMEALIEGILAYSRAGRTAGKIELVDTGKLVRSVIDLLSPPATAHLEIAPGMPLIQTERLVLEQVLMNLIGNAIKHGHVDRPEVTVQVAARDLLEAVEFIVIDDGPGIAPEYHERVWGIFQTLASRDKVEGTGVGLALVKKIVERRGGRVSLDSEKDKGATFRFTWPRQVGKEAEA